jgi:hypothetical protein
VAQATRPAQLTQRIQRARPCGHRVQRGRDRRGLTGGQGGAGEVVQELLRHGEPTWPGGGWRNLSEKATVAPVV